jgi:HTH-type transcriptional regulator, transcriptional repressor of NAD biosynthesis genes
MKKGLVLGKFLPLHKGHIALINFARQHCDFLYIIICFTKKEIVEGLVRKQWLYEELRLCDNISLISFPYDDNILPNSSESSRDVSKIWAVELKKIVPDTDVVFTSEPYGNFLAEYMNIEHIVFDEKRIAIPISATMINNNPIKYWDYLADSTKPWFVKKIVLLGSESTGKSTLAEKLAKYFNTPFVPEMARDIIEKTEECTFEHLKEIAILHAKRIGLAVGESNKLLFMDTDINITKSYSKFLFDKELIVEPWITEANKADLYLFLETDCPFVQDGTRLTEKERNSLSSFHKEQLIKNNIDFIAIGGDWNNRFNLAIDIIKRKYFA